MNKHYQMPLHNKEKQSTQIFYIMDEPQKHYSKCKKSDRKDCVLCGTICMEYQYK
jgi:hypothetical protein